MKTTYFKYTPVLLVAFFASSNVSALSYGGTAVGPNGGQGDIQQYTVDPNPPNYLIPNNAASIASVINVNNNGNKGNVELLTSSDSMSNATYNGAFTAGGGNTTLTVGFNDGSSMILSSLNAADWGAGVGSLLDTWSNAILSAYAPGYTPLQLTQFITAFQLYGGEQRLSDPNIQSVNVVGGVGASSVNIGLAGFLDASIFNESLPPEVTASGLIPKGAQVSEIVKATAFDKMGINLGSQYLYAIGIDPATVTASPVATPSGVQTADGSYNANFLLNFDRPGFEPGPEVVVPEPTELALLVAGLAGFLGLRRKTVKS